jgi:CRISPR-associated protein Csx16
MKTCYIVSRHPGAIEWLLARVGKHAQSVQVLSHLDSLLMGPGDVVCGVLPLVWAARICAQGARVLVLDLELAAHLRGVELSAVQLDELGARLVEYRVQQLPEAGLGLALPGDESMLR